MGPFPEEGSASHAQYFTKGVKANSCDLVTFPTAFTLYNRNDYKRCVCDSWFMDESDCILGKSGEQQFPRTDDGKSDVQRKAEAQKDLDHKRGTEQPLVGSTDEKPKAVPTEKPQLQESTAQIGK